MDQGINLYTSQITIVTKDIVFMTGNNVNGQLSVVFCS
jgi:hypothetical protein